MAPDAAPATRTSVNSVIQALRRAFLSLPEPKPAPWERATWLGLGVLTAFWGFLFAGTWGHWGNLTIDCGREMYVAAALAKGKTLYTDVWYPYTPASAYWNAALFRIFGINVAVLYWAGSLSALVSAALLYITGLHITSRIVAFTAGAMWLAEVFAGSLFCFPLPYSFGAVYGCVAACFCVWCIVNACATDRWLWMLGGGLAAAAALLNKQEIGVGCFLAVGLVGGVRALQAHTKGRLVRQIAIDLVALLPGAALTCAVIGWMVSLRGAEFITQENFMSWPTSYFMKKYGAMWLASTGFTLSAESLFRVAALAITVSLWFAARWLVTRGYGGVRTFLTGLLVLSAVAGLAAYNGGLPLFSIRMFFPRAAMVLILLAVPAAAWIYYLRRPATGFLKTAMLFSTTVLLAPRSLFGTRPEGYSIYYNGPVILSLLAIMAGIIFPKRALKDSRLGALRLAGALPFAGMAMALLVDASPWYFPNFPPVPLATPRGVVYAAPDKVRTYRMALDFIDRTKAEGARFLSIPEDVSLYFLSGTECPTRVYAFTPGVLAPGKMTADTIAQIEAARVRYLIWSNRTFPEYEAPQFGLDFDQTIGDYFRSHYRPVSKIEGVHNWDWSAVIWERIPEKQGPAN